MSGAMDTAKLANLTNTANNGISIKRITINDSSQLPKDFSTTPGGTFFSTTPGGTRIIYDRAFLLSRKETPLAKSPPANLPYIPEITLISPKENNNHSNSTCTDAKCVSANHVNHNNNNENRPRKDAPDNMQFEMDI